MAMIGSIDIPFTNSTQLANDAQNTADSKEKRIFRGTSEPLGTPENPLQANDLWLDENTAPPVWRRYTGGGWERFTRTDLAELDGQIKDEQIPLGLITEEKMKWSTHLIF